MMDYIDYLSDAWQKHLTPPDDDAPTVISTFAGGGGSSLGYSIAGYRELLAVEKDKNAVETFRMNFPDVPVYYGDIAGLSVDKCLELAGIQAGELDILDGSPPCQGFSTAGKRMLDDPRNQLFREYVRLLRGLRPKVFVMENVSGMVKGRMRILFAEIMHELRASGYNVSARLLNAMYFHVPQSRQRLIFIGVRKDLNVPPSHPKAESKPISVSEALQIDPSIGFLEYRHSYSKGRAKLARSGFDKPCLTTTKARGFSAKRYGDRIADLNKPLGTITKAGRWFLSNKEEFSIDAYKVLASFPLEYKTVGGFSAGKARIGNSVPPLMMEAIARHIKDTILAQC